MEAVPGPATDNSFFLTAQWTSSHGHLGGLQAGLKRALMLFALSGCEGLPNSEA